jgi:hypothetical protein
MLLLILFWVLIGVAGFFLLGLVEFGVLLFGAGVYRLIGLIMPPPLPLREGPAECYIITPASLLS